MANWSVKLLSIEDLTGEQRELAEIIGIDSYINLICEWGRDNIYIGKCDRAIKRMRNSQIKQDYFAGISVKYLAKKYSLTERSINNILCEERTAIKTEPGEGQISLF